jgi:hypothetical protein
VDELITQLARSGSGATLDELFAMNDEYAAQRFVGWLKADPIGTYAHWYINATVVNFGGVPTRNTSRVVSPAYVEPFVRMLRDSQTLVRQRRSGGWELRTLTISLLAETRDPRAGAAIVGAVNEDLSHTLVQMDGLDLPKWCEAIARCNYEEGLPTIERLLKASGNPTLNARLPAVAAMSLAMLDTPESFKALSRLLVVSDTHHWAVEALRSTSSRRAVPPLIDALSAHYRGRPGEPKGQVDEEDQKRRGEVYELLVAKTGQAGLGTDVAAWKAWWAKAGAPTEPSESKTTANP